MGGGASLPSLESEGDSEGQAWKEKRRRIRKGTKRTGLERNQESHRKSSNEQKGMSDTAV